MDVKLPQLGEGVDSGTVVSLLVKEGDPVTAGQALLELESEKAVAPIPSPAAGVVTRLRVKEGDRVTVGQVLLVLAEQGDSAPVPVPKTRAAATPAALPAATTSLAPAAALPAGVEPPAGPAIRKLARDLGLDLTRVRGSGPSGRVTLADVRAYLESVQQAAITPAAAAAPARPAAPAEAIDFAKWGPVTRQPLTTLRRTISQRLAESWNAIPHVTQFDEADITALNELRKKYAAAYEARGARLTLTSFALKAAVLALKAHPLFNASLDEARGELVFKEYFHLGVAVDTEHGLLVPVIRDVDKKDLLTLSREVGELADKARARKVTLEDLRGGTFTLSNQGGIGGGPFTPIVNRPEVAILGLGRGVVKPVVQNGRIEPRLMLPLAISYDHRVIDGGGAARFCVDLVRAFAEFPEAEVKL